jgi:hypothetical protein
MMTCQYCSNPFHSGKVKRKFCSVSCSTHFSWKNGRRQIFNVSCQVCRQTFITRDLRQKSCKGFCANRLTAARSVMKKRGVKNLEKIPELLRIEKCEICKETDDIDLCLDHDHQTKLLRGRLCQKCNRGLGSFRDDPKLLREAAFYLEESSSKKRNS